MKKYILTFVCLFQLAMFAQTSDTETNVSIAQAVNSARISLLAPAVAGEFKVGKNTTLMPSIALGLNTVSIELPGTTRNLTGIAFAPTFSVEPRYYYNFEKRQKKGKRTNGNSANYIEAMVTYLPSTRGYLYDEGEKYVNYKFSFPTRMSVASLWGINRKLGKVGIFDLGLGIAFHHISESQELGVQSQNRVSFASKLHLGFTIANW